MKWTEASDLLQRFFGRKLSLASLLSASFAFRAKTDWNSQTSFFLLLGDSFFFLSPQCDSETQITNGMAPNGAKCFNNTSHEIFTIFPSKKKQREKTFPTFFWALFFAFRPLKKVSFSFLFHFFFQRPISLESIGASDRHKEGRICRAITQNGDRY